MVHSYKNTRDTLRSIADKISFGKQLLKQKIARKHVLVFYLLPLIFLFKPTNAQSVLTGLDQAAAYQSLFKGKRVGVITNHTAYNRDGKHITNIFLDMKDVRLTALFGPEHGIRGKADAGQKVNSGKDPLNGIPVYSLYGKVRKPTNEMLKNVDVLVFDIQDIGSRFYTYIWTMALTMEAAAEQGKTFVVLDRPNPLNGQRVEGNILDPAYSTFVGLYPIPVRHGMTVGELARMFNGEGWLKNGVKADLKVVPLKNWSRSQWYDQTGLPFRKPSPNMPDLATATVYPGICLLEGTNVSEGRGTLQPFLHFGAPWTDGALLADSLNALRLPGVRFIADRFRPHAIKGMASHPKFEGRLCNGVKIQVTDRSLFRPFATGIRVTDQLFRLYADSLKWRISHFDRLCGTAAVREAIIKNNPLDSLFKRFEMQEKNFILQRKQYLLYK